MGLNAILNMFSFVPEGGIGQVIRFFPLAEVVINFPLSMPDCEVVRVEGKLSGVTEVPRTFQGGR